MTLRLLTHTAYAATLIACAPRSQIVGAVPCRPHYSVGPIVLDPAAVPTGELVGRVVDSESQALVPAVTVRLLGAAGLQDSTTTAEGRFQFDSLPAGTYEVQTTRIAYRPRVDSIELGRERGVSVALPLDLQFTDECGLGLVVRKPWWKFW